MVEEALGSVSSIQLLAIASLIQQEIRAQRWKFNTNQSSFILLQNPGAYTAKVIPISTSYDTRKFFYGCYFKSRGQSGTLWLFLYLDCTRSSWYRWCSQPLFQGTLPLISWSSPVHLDLFLTASSNRLWLLKKTRAERTKRLHTDAAASSEFYRFWGGLCSIGGHALFLALFGELVRSLSRQ